MKIITASIVLYNNDVEVVGRAIKSTLATNKVFKLYLIDNSLTAYLRLLQDDERIVYIHNPSNPGFGSAHNLAIDLATQVGSFCHFIINPDIYFDTDVISPMVNYMELHPEVGMMMPEVLYPDGKIQYLPKLLPAPSWILKRKFKFLSGSYDKFMDNYELRKADRKVIYNAPILSGCFSLLKLDVIKEIGSYDDRFFMYFEDFDLSRRVHQKYKTIYYPVVSVFHGYDSGANKSLKLFRIFLSSAVKYFNKWGWFFDNGRKDANGAAILQFNS